MAAGMQKDTTAAKQINGALRRTSQDRSCKGLEVIAKRLSMVEIRIGCVRSSCHRDWVKAVLREATRAAPKAVINAVEMAETYD